MNSEQPPRLASGTKTQAYSDLVVVVESLSKQYFLNRPQTSRSLRQVAEGLVFALPRSLAKAFLTKTANTTPEQPSIWALRNVDIQLKRGEILGIVGRNGSGKSTLLKILSRLTPPTSGRAFIRGRVASLLEVGVGFNHELSGRENIYLNGAIMGMSTAELDRKFASIVSFAEVEKFIDTPVKHYSSGMYIRLAFAVAVHLEPQILILDEVLAVGDLSFQKRCLKKIQEIRERGTTILMVSHAMQPILDLCTQAICLHEGHLVASGAPRDVVHHYLELNPEAELEGQKPIDRLPRNQSEFHGNSGLSFPAYGLRLRSAALSDPEFTEHGALPQHLDFTCQFEFERQPPAHEAQNQKDPQDQQNGEADSQETGQGREIATEFELQSHIELFDEHERLLLASRPVRVKFSSRPTQRLAVQLPGGWLEPGRYQLELVLAGAETKGQRCFQFQVVHTRIEGLGNRVQRPHLAWRTEAPHSEAGVL